MSRRAPRWVAQYLVGISLARIARLVRYAASGGNGNRIRVSNRI